MKLKTLKTLFVSAIAILGFSQLTFAQCDKTVTLKSSETNYLDDRGTLIRSKAEDVVITITPTDVTIEPGDKPKKSGKITSKTCNWTVPYKEGKMVVKSTINDGNAEKHVTLTIEGRDGKVTLSFEAEEMAGRRIQVVAEKFE